MIRIDKNKMYSTLINLCWVIIISSLLLKYCGYKDFEIPVLSYMEIHHIIRKLINCSFYCLNGYCFVIILLKRIPNVKETLITLSVNLLLFIITLFDELLSFKIILEIITYPILGIIFSKDKNYKLIIESIVIYLIFTLYQIITMSYKGINIKVNPVGFIPDKILQIDYYTLIILTVLNELKKGGYIYGRWFKFLDFLSKRRCIKESIQQNQKNVQEIEFGFKLFIILLSIAQFFVVGVACYFINGVIFEYIAIFVSFCVMRKVFGNSYHSDTIIKCTTLAIVVYVTGTRISLPLWLSTLCNVIIGCLIAYMMYIMYYYIKFTSISGTTIYRGMKLEDLNNLCDLYKIEQIDKTILVEYYVKRKRLDNIAIKLNYSVEAIKKRKAKVLKVFQESIK